MSHIVNLYSVKDIKSGFMDPVSFESLEIAKRDFVNFLKTIVLSFHYLSPSDLQLWSIGTLDFDTGCIVPCVPTLVIDGASVVFNDKEVSNASSVCDSPSD